MSTTPARTPAVGTCACFAGAPGDAGFASPADLDTAMPRRPNVDALAAALIPHGPWASCGAVISALFGRFAGRSFDRIVCLGPGDAASAALPAADATETPTGPFAHDEKALGLLARYPGLTRSAAGGALPQGLAAALHQLWPRARLVPLAVGPGADIAAISRALTNVLDEETLALATFNLSGRSAPAPSAPVTALLERALDPRTFDRLALELDGCGTEAALALVHAIGPGRAGVSVGDCAWSTSSGARSSMGAVFPGRFPSIPALSHEDRAQLGAIAEEAVAATVHGRDVRDLGPLSPRLEQRGGAFVTLRQRGSLRGCMGRLDAPTLARAVALAGHMAAQSDPRFRPLREDELGTLELEVSVLGPFVPISAPDQFVPGRHGLILTDGICRGLLLPQVATEYGMDREEFLEALAQKAGLPRGGWRHGRIERFGVEAFSPRALGAR